MSTHETHPAVIGMGGWDLFPFQGSFYPSRTAKGFRKLAFYSRYFDMIEVNATFYSTEFSPFHVRRWLDDVRENDDFTFTVKLFRGYTHSYDASKEDLLRIYRMLDSFQESGRLGGVLLQFPGSLKNRKECRDYLYRLSHAFRRYRMFLELRHASWDTPLMHNFFQENRFHLVNVDLPRVNDHIPFRALAWDGAAYFRMMGRNAAAWNAPWRVEADGRHMVSDRYLYRYKEEELRALGAAVKGLDPSVRKVYVVFHNDPRAQSLANGYQLRHLLTPERPLAIPATTLRVFPELRPFSASPEAAWRAPVPVTAEPMLAL